jgi:hypothetical protein
MAPHAWQRLDPCHLEQFQQLTDIVRPTVATAVTLTLINGVKLA